MWLKKFEFSFHYLLCKMILLDKKLGNILYGVCSSKNSTTGQEWYKLLQNTRKNICQIFIFCLDVRAFCSYYYIVYNILLYMLDPYVKFPAFKTHIYNYYIWTKHVASKLYLKYFNSYLPQQNYPKHVFKSLFFTLKFLKQLLIFLLNTTKNKTTKNITH